ncbi:hypothetical protein QJS10_CPB15g00916 [Acorus calamus]|uniref:TOG domain-containing protein n=1 Tax=Acorus calamus TaxID=4465 RepID=A0AAV9D8M8_ACOCL|nr:hypothetical protein QJS10_CPB15g00916 [Acorus calamus]
MSGKALRDLNLLPGAETRIDSCSKGSITKSITENSCENLDKRQMKFPVYLSSTPSNEVDSRNAGVEIGTSEVEYIESENLDDLADADASLSTILANLDSKNWVLLCAALNNVRRLSIFHKEMLLEFLGNVIPLIVKSLKNPRSAVCKTAIMTSADIFKVYSDHIIDSSEPLLVQLLLKSSQDKRFVCEAAERALIAMTTWVSPTLLLPKLIPHLKHKNPRIRAKASMCVSRSVPQLGVEGIIAYGIDKLIQIAASQLSDQLPESREAARSLALELQSVYEKSKPPPTEDSEQTETGSWECFCQEKLSPLNAQAVIRVTAGCAKEGVVLSC